jgi:hypothetical protein
LHETFVDEVTDSNPVWEWTQQYTNPELRLEQKVVKGTRADIMRLLCFGSCQLDGWVFDESVLLLWISLSCPWLLNITLPPWDKSTYVVLLWGLLELRVKKNGIFWNGPIVHISVWSKLCLHMMCTNHRYSWGWPAGYSRYLLGRSRGWTKYVLRDLCSYSMGIRNVIGTH